MRRMATLVPINDGRAGFLRVYEHGRGIGVDLWATTELSPAGQRACREIVGRYAARRRDRRPRPVALGAGPSWIYVERVAPAERQACITELLLAVLDDLAAAA